MVYPQHYRNQVQDQRVAPRLFSQFDDRGPFSGSYQKVLTAGPLPADQANQEHQTRLRLGSFEQQQHYAPMQPQQPDPSLVQYQHEVQATELRQNPQKFAQGPMDSFMSVQLMDHSLNQSLFETGNPEYDRTPFGAEHPHYGSPNKFVLSSIGEISYQTPRQGAISQQSCYNSQPSAAQQYEIQSPLLSQQGAQRTLNPVSHQYLGGTPSQQHMSSIEMHSRTGSYFSQTSPEQCHHGLSGFERVVWPSGAPIQNQATLTPSAVRQMPMQQTHQTHYSSMPTIESTPGTDRVATSSLSVSDTSSPLKMGMRPQNHQQVLMSSQAYYGLPSFTHSQLVSHDFQQQMPGPFMGPSQAQVMPKELQPQSMGAVQPSQVCSLAPLLNNMTIIPSKFQSQCQSTMPPAQLVPIPQGPAPALLAQQQPAATAKPSSGEKQAHRGGYQRQQQPDFGKSASSAGKASKGSGSQGVRRHGKQAHQQYGHGSTVSDELSQQIIHRFDRLPNGASQDLKQSILEGSVTCLAQTQTGSRFLQGQLARANPTLIEFLLSQVEDSLAEIMVNQYGNYFFQKFLCNCNAQQRLRILQSIRTKFIKICCHKQGTHTIQAIFNNVAHEEEELFIMQALQGHVFALSVDLQGTHVIRKVLQCRSFAAGRKQFIFEEIYARLFELCTNKNGLCVIKLVISHTHEREERQRVINQLEKRLIEIVSDAFGNYAVSEIVKQWDAEICQTIFSKLITKICELSMQKYSSCVIEACIEYAEEPIRSLFISKISSSPRLSALVSHQFGNYVIQTALTSASKSDKDTLIWALEACLDFVQDKKIQSKWFQIIELAQNSQLTFDELERLEELESLRVRHSEPSVDLGFEDREDGYEEAHNELGEHHEQISAARGLGKHFKNNSSGKRYSGSSAASYSNQPAHSQQHLVYQAKLQNRGNQPPQHLQPYIYEAGERPGTAQPEPTSPSQLARSVPSNQVNTQSSGRKSNVGQGTKGRKAAAEGQRRKQRQ